MDKKQILAALAILIGTFVLIVGSVIGIYFLFPQILGFAPQNHKNEQITKDTTKTKLDSLNAAKKRDSIELEIPYDSLKSITFALKDSLSRKKDIIEIYHDSIAGLVKRIVQLNSNEDKMIDSIRDAKSKMSKMLNNLQQIENTVKEKDSLFIAKVDSLTEINLITFAKIYNNTGANEVARILEKLDGKDAAKILKTMQAKKAGKVLEAMKPEIAAKILLNGSN